MTGNKPLWAPWRVEYILGDKPAGCIFCPAEGVDRQKALILLETQHSIVLLNMFPYNSGHVMIAPKKHTAELTALTHEEAVDMFDLERESVEILKREYKPNGFNIGMNLGTAGGAGVKDHLHLHVVPRWNGDSNFMPVVAETKVMPEHLQETYGRLKPHFDALSKKP
jgi:ATP adenylyltransferase